MLDPYGFVVDAHFDIPVNPEAQQRLFFQSIVMVEIEVFSYCNRRCWFCPNSFVDRLSKNHYMDEGLYLSILGQLACIGYGKMISYSRYNEPLADRIILTRIRQARTYLPKALLHLNTNGDFLTCDYLEELYRAGLNSLNIQVYLGNADLYDHEKMRTRMGEIIKKLKLPSAPTTDRADEWLESHLSFQDMKLRIYARNFAINGCSRGDSVPIRRAFIRTSPCLLPFVHLIIDYTGKVMPCCNLRSDIPEHKSAIIVDLAARPDIFEAYSGQTMAVWRRQLAGFGEKSGLCRSCAFALIDSTDENREVHSAMAEMARGKGVI